AATLLLGIFFNLHLYAQEGLMIFAAGLLFDDYLRRSGQPRAGMAALATLGPALWLATEFVVPPRFIRAPVVLQLVLGAWIARALLRERTSGLRRDQPAGASDL
ncbi:MAG TPA: hypothetical protein VN914_01275, partial [Polyangia bacterium]|nr:hypothetical protein [Polyangia bacterium]